VCLKPRRQCPSKCSVFEAITWRLRFDSPCKHTLCNIGYNTELRTDLSSYMSFWHNKRYLLKTNSWENERRAIFIGPATAKFTVHIRYCWFRFGSFWGSSCYYTFEWNCMCNKFIYATCFKLMSHLLHTLLFLNNLTNSSKVFLFFSKWK